MAFRLSNSDIPSEQSPRAVPARPEAPPSILLKPNIVERFHWNGVYQDSQPVELEIGAGDGSFVVQYAALHPERNFLAIERLLGRIRKIDRKSLRLGLRNVRALRLEASYVLRWMIPPGSLNAIHVYFPDPWPKRRHWKRRLINTEFTELTAWTLVPGGRVFLRTDHADYFAQMMEVFSASPYFSPVEAPAELLAVRTDFEVDFHAQGLPTRQSAWQLKPGIVPPPAVRIIEWDSSSPDDPPTEAP